jgi:hypothetical protein
MRARHSVGLALLLLLAAAPLSAPAQRSALREVRDAGNAGISVVVAQPLDAFRSYANAAAGVEAFGVIGLRRGSALGVRVDGGFLLYGTDRYGRGVSTEYSIGTLGVGPQLTLGRGPLRLYGFATVGGSLFWTSTSFHDYCGCYDSESLYDDAHVTSATQLGAGLLITVSRRHTPVAIDLGVRDMRNSRVQYVPAGGVVQDGYGGFVVQHVATDVRLRVFHIGISIGLRH